MSPDTNGMVLQLLVESVRMVTYIILPFHGEIPGYSSCFSWHVITPPVTSSHNINPATMVGAHHNGHSKFSKLGTWKIFPAVPQKKKRYKNCLSTQNIGFKRSSPFFGSGSIIQNYTSDTDLRIR